MSKNLDETLRFESEKRQEWIREVSGERLQKIEESRSRAPLLVSSVVLREFLGTHCTLIAKEKRKDSSCHMCHRI